MATARPWWSCLGKLLVTLVMTMVVMGGAIDGIVCANEPAAAGVASAADGHTHAVVADDAAQHGSDSHKSDLDKGVCAHGHCHHPAAYVLPDAAADASPILISGRLALERSAASKSDLHFQLKRPPRA